MCRLNAVENMRYKFLQQPPRPHLFLNNAHAHSLQVETSFSSSLLPVASSSLSSNGDDAEVSTTIRDDQNDSSMEDCSSSSSSSSSSSLLTLSQHSLRVEYNPPPCEALLNEDNDLENADDPSSVMSEYLRAIHDRLKAETSSNVSTTN